MAGPSKRVRTDLNVQGNTEDGLQELYMDSDSEEEFHENDVNLGDIESSDGDDENEPVVFRPRIPGDEPDILAFTGPQPGINHASAPNINAESSPLDIFILFYKEVLDIVLEESNTYLQQCIEARPGTRAPPQGIRMQDLYNFLAIIIQMGHCHRDSLKDYWSKSEQYYTQFYSKIMNRDRFLQILKYLHFANNENPPDRNAPNYDRLWKIRKIFDTVNNKFQEFYNPSEHLALDEVIVLYKGRVVFRQYIPKKHKRFGIKIYKLCDSSGYTYDMSVYLGKQRQQGTARITPTHGTVLQLVERVIGVGHKIYMDSYFSSPALFDDLLQLNIHACGTVRYSRKGMPSNFGPKVLKLKKGDIISRVRDNLSAVCWKDKREVYILTNMHASPAEGNFRDDHGNALKPHCIEDYNIHMGYVDKSDRMANSYSIARRTWKWTKKFFFSYNRYDHPERFHLA